MRTQLQIGGYELEFDQDATAACYASVRVPGPEACGCADCRNWVAARQQVLPPEMRQLLAQLGIPADGEIEVMETPGPSQPHLYSGWYFVVGSILSGGGNRTFHMGSFELSFGSGQSFAVAEFKGQELFELHFHTEVREYLTEAERASPPQPRSL
jgi:hypothetical protein